MDRVALDLVDRSRGGGHRNGGEGVVRAGLGPGRTATKRGRSTDVVPGHIETLTRPVGGGTDQDHVVDH